MIAIGLKITAKWFGFIVERTLLLLGGVLFGVATDVLRWAIDLVLFPIRCMRVFELALAQSKKGGQNNDR